MRLKLFALAFVIFGASTAIAATTAPPTDVRDVLDPLLRPYQEVGTANCTSQGNCAIVFPAIAAQIVLILHVSCDFTLATGGSFVVASLGSQQSPAANSFSTSSHAAPGGLTEYIINAGTYLFVNNGDQPLVDVVSNGAPVQSLACTVTGHYR